MKYLRSTILLGFALLPGIVAAQVRSVPMQPVQAAQPAAQNAAAAQPAPQLPKLVPALNWDAVKQSAFTTCVTVDPQNNVWVGTEGKGLWRYDARKKDWTQFTSKDGLGDDTIYALAVDKQGRVWAGHLNHGVSVYNGDKWKNYGVADGPLGSRVFAIATCPTDGDVWIATEIGVARYSLADDDWDYFTSASGLPSNQIQAIAFDGKGNIFLGTQCDGIAMADAKDKYQKWALAKGLPGMPDASTGTGLASSMINSMVMATPPPNAVAGGEAERLIVGMPLGISTSSDYGDHFNFIRGDDWQDNVKGLFAPADAANNAQAAAGGNRIIRGGGVFFGGPGPVVIAGGVVAGGGVVMVNGVVQAGNAQAGFLLREDWVNCVHQEKETGKLWVGYRNKGLEVRNFGITPSIRFDSESDTMDVRGIWTSDKTPALIAVYDEKNGGLKMPADSTVTLTPGDPPPDEAPALPSPAKAPTSDDIDPLTKRLGFFKNELTTGDAMFIGDDWSTGGDWVGRYGNSYAMLTSQDRFEREEGFSATVDLGPHTKPQFNEPLDHGEDTKTDDVHVLYYPALGRRDLNEVDDQSFNTDTYPPSWEGPGLWVTVEVPKGVHCLSLYFQNYDSQSGSDNKLRDYEIEIRRPAETQALALKGDPLAHARVTDFWGGVYKQFAVAGPAKYVVYIKRDRSYVTKLLGLFIDRAVLDPSIDKKPLPGFDNVKYSAPEPPDNLDTDNNPNLSSAVDLWDAVVDSVDKRAAIPLEQQLGIWVYRTGVANKAPDSLLASWRWQLGIWNEGDRQEFDKAMKEAFKAYQKKNPDAGKDGGDASAEEK